MVLTPPKPPTPRQHQMDLLPASVERFIEAHRSSSYPRMLLEPGWGGQLAEEEVLYIQDALFRDPVLCRRWGFRPGQKTRPEEGIRRVSRDGDPNGTAHNRALARPRKAALNAA